MKAVMRRVVGCQFLKAGMGGDIVFFDVTPRCTAGPGTQEVLNEW